MNETSTARLKLALSVLGLGFPICVVKPMENVGFGFQIGVHFGVPFGVPFGVRFGVHFGVHFGSILGPFWVIVWTTKTPFQNVRPSGRICWSFFDSKNEKSKSHLQISAAYPTSLIFPPPDLFFFFLFAPPHFCPPTNALNFDARPPEAEFFAREICPAPPAKNGPPDRRRRIFLAEGSKMARRRRKFGRKFQQLA